MQQCVSDNDFQRQIKRVISFFEWDILGVFFVYFGLFKQTLQFLQQINMKNCPSSIRYLDSSSQRLECQSPPITTRSGLPPSKEKKNECTIERVREQENKLFNRKWRQRLLCDHCVLRTCLPPPVGRNSLLYIDYLFFTIGL